MSRKSVHLWITGKVQRVGYRNWLVDEATAKGLAGWTRNRRDGAVEAVVAGPAAEVDALIAAAHLGPPAALVGAVRVTEVPEPAGSGFAREPTV